MPSPQVNFVYPVRNEQKAPVFITRHTLCLLLVSFSSLACNVNTMAGVVAALMDEEVTLKVAAASGMLAPED